MKPVTCPFCSLHCDDLHLEPGGGHWVLQSPECNLAKKKYLQKPKLEFSFDPKQIKKTGQWLVRARHPLLVLDGSVDQDAVISSIELSRSINAGLIYSGDAIGTSLSLAMQSVGLLSATLGDLKELAEQVIIFGQMPEESLPRFWGFIGTQKERKPSVLMTLPLSSFCNNSD